MAARVGPVGFYSVVHTECVRCGGPISLVKQKLFHSTCSHLCLMHHVVGLEMARTGASAADIMAEIIAARVAPARPDGVTRQPLAVPAESHLSPKREARWPALASIVVQWPAIIESLRSEGMAQLRGLLNGSIPTSVTDDGTIVVQCASSFALQKLQPAGFGIALERLLSLRYGQQLRIRFEF